MLQLICLFCFQNPPKSSLARLPPKRSQGSLQGSLLGSPWPPLASIWRHFGPLGGSVWLPMGCQRYQSAPMGLPSAPKRVPNAFAGHQGAPKGVLKGSQGGCLNDGNCFPYCLGSRAGVIDLQGSQFLEVYRCLWPRSFYSSLYRRSCEGWQARCYLDCTRQTCHSCRCCPGCSEMGCTYSASTYRS